MLPQCFIGLTDDFSCAYSGEISDKKPGKCFLKNRTGVFRLYCATLSIRYKQVRQNKPVVKWENLETVANKQEETKQSTVCRLDSRKRKTTTNSQISNPNVLLVPKIICESVEKSVTELKPVAGDIPTEMSHLHMQPRHRLD